jgi:hypothetical protein
MKIKNIICNDFLIVKNREITNKRKRKNNNDNNKQSLLNGRYIINGANKE